ncbi:MAG TPA: hypothetical protein VMD29_09970 [Terracidiphilus sp.]|nr:hypothetical protein [Terracidiphilus sp.]
MLTIEAGMNRKQLNRIFTTEGGLSTALQRTFVSRDCPYFKVEVTFVRAGNSGGAVSRAERLQEFDDDVIANISKPYLAFTIAD